VAPNASPFRAAVNLIPKTWEHLFVTAQGSAYARFRRALDTGNVTIALAAAAELDFVSPAGCA
jgi:hypothetical protein